VHTLETTYSLATQPCLSKGLMRNLLLPFSTITLHICLIYNMFYMQNINNEICEESNSIRSSLLFLKVRS